MLRYPAGSCRVGCPTSARTSPGTGGRPAHSDESISTRRIESILLAAFVELPLAAVCIWLSWHTQQLDEQRIVLLMRRYRGRLSWGRRRARS